MKNKSGFVSVIGRPNVGKSTLLNRIMGYKILIESNKPQATRNSIHCIYNEERGQVVFLDTPGIHKPHHKLGESLVSSAKRALKDVDLILFMVEPDNQLGPGDKYIAEILKDISIPCALVLNKIDSVSKEDIILILSRWAELYDFDEYIPISATSGENVDRLKDLIFSYLEEGPMYYPEDMITDRPEEFVVIEMIREKIFNNTMEEIPYSVAVDLRDYEQREDIMYIAADIIVERDSQKGIIIGKRGSMLKKIGSEARKDIENLLATKVYLDLHVRYKKDWRNKDSILKELGYKED
ncbi:MAG: GTPase Era [Clostridia bacterium]